MAIVINGELLELDNLWLPENNDYKKIINSDFYDYLYNNYNNLFADNYKITITINGEEYTIININDTYYDNYYFYLVKGTQNIDYTRSIIISDEFFYTHNDDYLVNRDSNEDFCYCDSCGEYYHYDDITHTEDDYYYCYRCTENYFYCENCNRYYSNHFGYHYNEEDECYYCDNCWQENQTTNTISYDTTKNEIIGTIDTTQNYDKPISSYHNYNRAFVFRKLDSEDTKEFYGVELETENKGSFDNIKVASYILNNLNCVCANDGSLSYGFEIISDPQSFNYWLSRKEKIEKVFNELTSHGIRSDETTTCGLHIHVSREALGDTQKEQENIITKLELIIENFKEQIKTFSRRNGNYGYCKFLSDITRIELSTEDIKLKKSNNTQRYQVLNLNPQKTIEFRVFKGTLNINTFYASLQLVHNLIQVAKNKDYIGKTWQHIINLNNYKELKDYNKIREIKTALKIKDYTIKLHNKRIKKDQKMKLLFDNQNKIINNLQEYTAKNVYIINHIYNVYNNNIIGHISYMTPQNKLIELKNLSRILNDTTDNLSYINYITYTTLDNQKYKIYDHKVLNDTIKKIKNTIKEFKSIIKGVK